MEAVAILLLPVVLGFLCMLLQAALTATRLAAGTTLRLGPVRYASLAHFVGEFGRELGLAGATTSPEPDATSVRFVGELDSGRGARVEFRRVSWGAPALARVAVALEPGEVARVRRHARAAALDRWGVSEPLELTPRTGQRGRSEVELAALVPEERATAGELAVVLAELEALALAARERPCVHLRPSEPARRCALCHGELECGREPDHAPCERCGAVLHRACWHELGRCPNLACPGRARLSEAGPLVRVPPGTA